MPNTVNKVPHAAVTLSKAGSGLAQALAELSALLKVVGALSNTIRRV
jgi:hypothetical protein